MKSLRKNNGLFMLPLQMFEDREYIRRVLYIALPVSLQMLLKMIVNFADTVMIGKLGETSIAGVGLANKYFFVFILFIFGIESGTGILASQYWGNGDIKNIRKVLGLGLLLSVAGSIILTLIAFFMPEKIMMIFTESDNTIAIGATYLGVLCLSYPFIAATDIYVSTMRAVGEVKVPVIASVFAIILNIALNYILIFGKFGLPMLGVVGAAIATVIARIFEFILTITLITIKKSPIICPIAKLNPFSKELITQFAKTALPVIVNEFFWGIGTTLYSVAYGRMGDAAVAAITISTALQDLMVVSFQGIAMATVVILGNEMGANNLKKAKQYGSYSYIMTFLVGVIASMLIMIFRLPFVSLYNVSDNVINDVKICLLVFAVYFPLKAVAAVNIVGILRSGGDTLACLFLDLSSVWLIGVPMAFLGGLYFKFPIYTVYAMVLSSEIYKVVGGYIRYRQGKWLKNLAIELTAN